MDTVGCKGGQLGAHSTSWLGYFDHLGPCKCFSITTNGQRTLARLESLSQRSSVRSSCIHLPGLCVLEDSMSGLWRVYPFFSAESGGGIRPLFSWIRYTSASWHWLKCFFLCVKTISLEVFTEFKIRCFSEFDINAIWDFYTQCSHKICEDTIYGHVFMTCLRGTPSNWLVCIVSPFVSFKLIVILIVTCVRYESLILIAGKQCIFTVFGRVPRLDSLSITFFLSVRMNNEYQICCDRNWLWLL